MYHTTIGLRALQCDLDKLSKLPVNEGYDW